jgi:hypothetical protein
MSRTIKTISKIRPMIDSSSQALIESAKEAGVVEHPQVSDHAGLLFDEPPGQAGLLFI